MKLERVEIGRKESSSVLLILAAAIVFPLTVIFWALNYFFRVISVEDEIEGKEHVTPSRWLVSIGITVIIILHGLKKKSLNGSGALLAFPVGFFCTISSYCFLASLLAFFLTSSKATKFRAKNKEKIEKEFKEGGQRNWIQVLCNGGMATELAILYVLDVGYGQMPIDFQNSYRASWLGIGVLGALSCANGDTWASELGTVIGTTAPRLITSLSKVPKGTNGGITVPGLIFSFLGGVAVGAGYYLALILTVDSTILTNSPPQWLVIIVGGIGGLLGSIIDSLIGATFQFSGIDDKGVIHEIPGANVRHISGWPLLDNHSVNLLSTILTGIFLPSVAMSLWTTAETM